MRIGNINNYIVPESLSYSRSNKPEKKEGEFKQSYDALTISKDSRMLSDKHFVHNKVEGLRKELRKFTTEDRLNSLRERIENGSYSIDYSMLASKILREA